MKMNRILLLLLACAVLSVGMAAQAEPATNPVIWADVPDVAVIRVDDTYYMSSTTMHMSPGVPIMKSKNLVDWNLVSYAYDTLGDIPALRLEGRDAYGKGTWASCLRYHDGRFYASTFSSTTGMTYIYSTDDIESGEWKTQSFRPSLHDSSLIFDDDGKVYMMTGGGNLRLVELKEDLSGIKEGGFDDIVIREAHSVVGRPINLNAEGTQVLKVNGMYYVMNICWPRGGMRTQIVHRSDKITGPYEGRVILEDKGVAQGCLIDTPDGEWYAMLFQDNGSVGRSPWIVPVTWEDGWPVLGIDGKAPTTLDIESTQEGMGNICVSDEFDRAPGEALPLAWQWNHNPDNDNWSIGEREGYLRITTARVDQDVTHTRNMLTQRTFGPTCAGSTCVDASGLKDGDTAGLINLQENFGYLGVKKEGDSKFIVMADRRQEVVRVPLEQDIAYFKIECDYRNRADRAYFYYSLDGENWTKVDYALRMQYTLSHFMGYRYGLFNWASKETGGIADFDYYHVTEEVSFD